MIQDRIVVGLRDLNLSKRPQSDPELTLDKAIMMARWAETVREQQAVVRGKTDNAYTRIEPVEHSYFNKSYGLYSKSAGCQSIQQERLHQMYQVSNTFKCLAREATCCKCKKQGHYQSVCRSVTNLATIQTDTVNKEPFLGAIEMISTHSKDNQWMIELLLNRKLVQFKIDTGTHVTIISEEIF